MNKTEELIGIFGTLCDYMVDNGRCDVFCPYAETKEKGELLNKVSGGDVLRICQLENQLQVELDNSHCLEIELTEAKRLLKSATDIIKDVDCNEDYLCDECEYRAKCDGGFSFYWRYANEAENLLSDEK